MTAVEIFGVEDDFVYYKTTIQIRHRMVGGIPSNPSVIYAWLKNRLQEKDQVIKEMAAKVYEQRGNDISLDEVVEGIMSDPSSLPNVNGFLRNKSGHLMFEGRCLKACIKEAANSVYPGVEWPGKTDVAKGFRKGLMGTLAERIFVEEDKVPLLDMDGGTIDDDHPALKQEERIKHVKTPQGPRSAISRCDVVETPQIEFTVKIRNSDALNKVWPSIWQAAEEIGVGSDRARSDGRFDLTRWERK